MGMVFIAIAASTVNVLFGVIAAVITAGSLFVAGFIPIPKGSLLTTIVPSWVNEAADNLSGADVSDEDLVFLGAVMQRQGIMIQTKNSQGQTIARPVNPATDRSVIAPVAAAVNQVNNQRVLASTLGREAKFLLSKRKELDVDVNRDIQEGKLRFRPADLYFRKLISSGGSNSTIIDFIQAQDDMSVGTRNMQGNVIPQGHIFTIGAVKLAYAYNNTPNDNPAQQLYTNAMDAETGGSTPIAIPAGLLNGEVTFRVNGAVLFSLPIKRFFRESLSVGVGVEGVNDALKLETPIILKKGDTISLSVNYAAAVTPSGANDRHFLEFRLMGLSIAPRG